MHPKASIPVSHNGGLNFAVVRRYAGLDAVGNGIVGMKNVEDASATSQKKVFTERSSLISNHQKDGDRTAQQKEVVNAKVELRI